MVLRELLHLLRYDILHDRSDQVDGDGSDYLWSDWTLVKFIDEAQRRFARRALVIQDATTPQCTEVTVASYTKEYPLDTSVISVKSAKLASFDDNGVMQYNHADLARAGHTALGTYHTPDPYFFDPSQLSNMTPGKPMAYATDEGVTADDEGTMSVVNLRLYPVPSPEYAGQIVKLRVIRMPLDRLYYRNLEATPEVPEIYHLDMLDWAAYLALRIVDRDAGDSPRANEFRASFDDHVKTARNEMLRKMFTPMQWGFGRNGFSWEGN